MYRWLGVSKTTYRQVKLAFRQSGLKRAMPAFTGASELTRTLRRRGAEVWICTTRPYLRLDNIDPDTRHWLRRNRIQYDGVLFGERKYRDLVKIVGRERVVGILDDLPEMMEQADKVGVLPFLRHQPWNEHLDVGSRRVRGMSPAVYLFIGLLDDWKRRNR